MYNTSINRISGLASGLDTDSIVKKLMDAESVRLNKMKQDQQKYEWESDGYRQWNTDLFSFRSTTLFDMKMSGTYGTYDVSSTDSVTGTATADAIPGTYKIQVDQLAQSATMVSNVTLDPTKTLGELGFSSGSFTITTTDHTVPATNRTQTISIDATKEKIGDLVSKLNNAHDATGNSLGLQAIYDNTLHQFILRTKDTGAGTSIKVTNDSGLFGSTLNFSASVNAQFSNGVKLNGIDFSSITLTDSPNNKYAAADAKIYFNESATATPSSSNELTIMGVNYTLKSTTPSGSPSTITVSRDLDKEVTNIKDFISKYNDILDKLNTAVSEPVYRDYQPLTDDQRSAMSDKQIEQWEAKAKSGLFHNDSILSGIVNNMRNHTTSTVANGSKYNSLSAIGIESTSYEDKGKLYVDETKLRAALQDDPDAVKNLFIQDPANPTPGQRGIIPQLYDDFNDAVEQLTNKAGSTGNQQNDQSVVGKLLDSLNKQIDTEQQRLTDKENQYYNQFTAMEKAMSKYNSQSSWLSQQLGLGSN